MAGTNAAHSVDSSSSFFLTKLWYCLESKMSDQREWSAICLGVSMWNLEGSLLGIQRRIFLRIKSLSQPLISPSHKGNQISDGKLMVKANKEHPRPWALMLGRRGSPGKSEWPWSWKAVVSISGIPGSRVLASSSSSYSLYSDCQQHKTLHRPVSVLLPTSMTSCMFFALPRRLCPMFGEFQFNAHNIFSGKWQTHLCSL